MKRYRVDEIENHPLQDNVAATEILNNNDKTPCDSVRRRDKKAE